MMNCFNIVLIFSTFASVISSAKIIQTDSIDTNFLKLNEKFDQLKYKIDKLEAISSAGNKIINLDEINSSFKQMESFVEEFVRKLVRIQEQSDKTDRNNPFWSQLLTYQKKKDHGSTSELISTLTDECTSVCRSKADEWDIRTRLHIRESLENCFHRNKDQKREGVCHPNPCQHGGRCDVTSTGDYQCTQCPYPTSGKRCEQLHCGDNTCFARNGIYYEVIDQSIGWDHAHRLCLQRGMRLAYSKDKETTEFLVTKLKSIYAHGHVWMGLKYNEVEKQWQWVGGSPLGDYTGNKANFKSYVSQPCAVLYLNDANVLWESYECSRSSVLLCEKRYFID